MIICCGDTPNPTPNPLVASCFISPVVCCMHLYLLAMLRQRSRCCICIRAAQLYILSRDCVLCGMWSCCAYIYIHLNLCCVRGRHSLAAPCGPQLQPEITALVRRGRKSFDSPLAMMHTRGSSAHVSLIAFCCESCAQDMRPAASRGEGVCAPRRALAVGTLPRPLRGLRGPRHFCQYLLSCLDQPGRALRHRRAAPTTPSSASSSATFISASLAWSHGAHRWTRGKTFAAFHWPLHHALTAFHWPPHHALILRRTQRNLFWVKIIRTLTPRSVAHRALPRG